LRLFVVSASLLQHPALFLHWEVNLLDLIPNLLLSACISFLVISTIGRDLIFAFVLSPAHAQDFPTSRDPSLRSG
ncbi:MAG: hypothetical protein JZU72_01935, partial [Chlorobium phaeobacteroides]|nr:hypothetical protein [Chlorobium phaeobacteroides]